MIIRSCIATVCSLALVSFLFVGEAVANDKIALLISLEEGPFKEVVAGFSEYLGKQGAQTTYDLFSLEGSATKTSAAIKKIGQNKYSLILSLGALATDAAVKDVVDTPIVAGLILKADALKKAPNATGVGLDFSLETQLSWIQKVLPGAHTIGVLYSPQENKKKIEMAARVAQKLGLKLEAQEVSSPQDVPSALERLAKKADVLWGLADTLVLTPQSAKPILLFSFQNSIPFIGPSTMWVKAGALYSLDYDYRELGAQCGELALKALKGARAGDIPPDVPRSIKYSLNMTTARALKIRLDDNLVQGALHTY